MSSTARRNLTSDERAKRVHWRSGTSAAVHRGQGMGEPTRDGGSSGKDWQLPGRPRTAPGRRAPERVVCRSLRERSGHSAEPQLNSVSLAAHNPGPKSTAQYLTVKGVLVLSRHG